MRVTIAHDYLTSRGGAERVALAMLRAFPGATLVTSMYDPAATFPEFRDHDVRSTWLGRVPLARRDPRFALPLLAPAFSTVDVPRSDVVICSSSGWAHGVRTDAPKIVYCHNPPRWLYQTSEYAAEQRLPVRLALELMRTRLTAWDRAAARSATLYLVNSGIVRQRVMLAYGRDAEVLPPPVAIDVTGPRSPVPGVAPGFLLSVSRARGYKHADRLTAAMRHLPGERLVILGAGPTPTSPGSSPSRIVHLSDVPDAQLRWLYANCSGLLAVGHEDFGLTPLEANAFGKPVACLRAGGYLDSLAPDVSGVFVDALTPEGIADAVSRLRATPFDRAAILAHAHRYSESAFRASLRAAVVRATTRTPSIIPLPRPRVVDVRSPEPARAIPS